MLKVWKVGTQVSDKRVDQDQVAGVYVVIVELEGQGQEMREVECFFKLQEVALHYFEDYDVDHVLVIVWKVLVSKVWVILAATARLVLAFLPLILQQLL